MGIMFNFVEIYRSVVNPLTTFQKLISISFSLKKKPSGFHSNPTLGGPGLKIRMNPVHRFLYVEINIEAGLHRAFAIIQPLFSICNNLFLIILILNFVILCNSYISLESDLT